MKNAKEMNEISMGAIESKLSDTDKSKLINDFIADQIINSITLAASLGATSTRIPIISNIANIIPCYILDQNYKNNIETYLDYSINILEHDFGYYAEYNDGNLIVYWNKKTIEK